MNSSIWFHARIQKEGGAGGPDILLHGQGFVTESKNKKFLLRK